MKTSIIELDGADTKKVDLPDVFSSPLRGDLVKRAYWLLNSHRLQPKGRDPMAGMKTSAETSNPPTGRGVSRIPRVKGDRYSRSGQAGGVASIVKGRLAHPPKSEKRTYLKINKKERRLALSAAIAFTGNANAVLARGHSVKKIDLPIVVTDEIESLSKTSELVGFLRKIGLGEEMNRLDNGVRQNSGKSNLRGRAYKTRKGPLIVITNDRGLVNAASAIPGTEITRVDSLDILALAPGGVPGRLTLWTESSLDGFRHGKGEAR
jgi:large subunit ribosomal protein L4e